MRNFVVAAALAAAFVSCSQQQPGVTFALSSLESDDSVKIFVDSLSKKRQSAGTFAIPSGALSLPSTADVALIYNVYKVPRKFPDGSMEAMSMRGIYVPVLPGAAVKVEGDFNNYTVTGNTPFYKELEALEAQIKPLRQEAFKCAVASYDKTRPQSQRDSLAAIVGDCERRVYDIVADFVDNNNDSDVAVYAFYHYGDIENDYEHFEKLSESAGKGLFAPFYNEVVARYNKIQKDKEAEKLVVNGAVAPDFTLKSIDGKEIALSSLRGKYVVLDFWGSWCGWCIKGIPEMKKMYGKYNKRLEVVGIACGDTEDAWKKCVAENKLPWTNLINGGGENNVPEKYAIKGYPTKIILDKDGRIVKTVLGESPEFYNVIDSLMAL